METPSIEIWPNKKYLVVFAIILVVAMIASTWYIFTTEKYAGFHFIKIVQPILAIYAFVVAYKIQKRVRNNQPFITIATDSLTINSGRIQETFPWSEISAVSTSEEDNNTYLVLFLSAGEKKVSVSWLDRQPSEILRLVEDYRKQAI